MLRTALTEMLSLRLPIVGAPMASVGHGRLARAVSSAGGLGMIGVGSADRAELVEREAAVARGEDGTPFGIGLMAWALPDRPDLLDATLAARPRLVSVSFGSPAPYVDRLHDAGILVATQVPDAASAREAVAAGADLLVAQGAEAGGHAGDVGTLPLLQRLLDSVDIPVLAAGGIATGRGVAAALAAGAAGVWVGTCLLACPETAATDAARRRVVAAEETDTVRTRVFDLAQRIPWPEGFPGRALRNGFTQRWHGREDELAAHPAAADELRDARRAQDYDTMYVYAGQAVGLVSAERPAAEVVRELGEAAERQLRESMRSLGLAQPSRSTT